MPVNLEPEDRDALVRAIHAAIANTQRAIYDPDPLDFAEAAMEALADRGIIRLRVEGEPDHDPQAVRLSTELADVILSAKGPDGTEGVALRLSPQQALDVYLALPTHINEAQSYIE